MMEPISPRLPDSLPLQPPVALAHCLTGEEKVRQAGEASALRCPPEWAELATSYLKEFQWPLIRSDHCPLCSFPGCSMGTRSPRLPRDCLTGWCPYSCCE